jgi:hypothetical protein
MTLTYTGTDDRRHSIEASITTDHSASSYGQPVIVLEDDGALDYSSAILLAYQLVQADDAELALLDAWRRNMPPIG